MRVLVIGGTGTISTAIVRELLHKGHEVSVLNRGTREVEGVTQITADRYHREAFLRAVENRKFDCVIDMICYREEDARSLCEAFGGRTPQIIFCSTVDVYKKPAAYYPITEDTPLGADPAFEYAWHKVECERILREEAEKGSFALTVVRPAATYSDHSTPISPVGDGRGLMHRIRVGKPLIVIGDGSSLWSSGHSDDVGRAIANAVGNPKAMNNCYTLASHEAITWEQYYRTVAEVMGAPAPDIVGIHWRELVRAGRGACDWIGCNFRFNNVFDCTRAREDLDFQITVTWREGVERLVRYHEQQGNIDAKYEDPLYDQILAEVKGSRV